MNRSYIEHALIAVLIQFALWPFLESMWWGGALAVTLFLGREIAQNEYRLANRRGWLWGRMLPVAWHEGAWRGWTIKSMFDVLSPALACALLAWLSRYCPLLS